MSDGISVLHVVPAFSPVSETFIYDLVTAQAAQGARLAVATRRRENENRRPFEPVHVLEPPGRWNPSRLAARAAGLLSPDQISQASWPAMRTQLRRLIETHRADLVHAHFGPAGVLAAPAAQRAGVPLVTTFYGYDATVLPRNAAWRKAYAQLFGGASRLVGISNHICGLLHRLGAPPECVSMVHLGVHLDQFPFAPPKARYQNGPVRCLHVGRLVEKKAPVHLVRAIGAAAPRVPAGLQLTMVGEGPLRQEVESEIERLGLSETVDLLGRVPHHEVKAQFQQAHLYTQHCLTASDGDQEGQGVSFVEASATGLPVVATRHNGLVDVIEDGVTGYLVEEGDVDAMADRIVELANAPETWDTMGTAGRRRVEERFDAVAQTAHMLDLYRSVLS